MTGTVLVVDDTPEIRRLISVILRQNTEYDLLEASSGEEAIEIIRKAEPLPDLIVLDIMMPEMSGIDTAEVIKSLLEKPENVPIIFITALDDQSNITRAYHAGGVDFITKPFRKWELLARINAHMELKNLRDNLYRVVDEKTNQIENMTISMVTALETANLFNDTDTGNHIQRVKEYSGLLAELCGKNSGYIQNIKLYASLHDIGKVGIPDEILKKTGRFDEEERVLMMNHVTIGSKMLENAQMDDMARNIILYHHEKWNGKGYVSGMKGEEIPLEARIVALADVYDALTTERPYKKPFSHEQAEEIIGEGRGSHFDPHLVDLFMENSHKFEETGSIYQ